MGNCVSCTHKNVAFPDSGKALDGMISVAESQFDMHVSCSKGHSERCAEFYYRNANKNVNDIKETLDCYEKTEIAKKLDKLAELLSEMRETI